jgi:hypothetical protein
VLVVAAGVVRHVTRDGEPVVTLPSPSAVASGAPKVSGSPSPPAPVLQKPGDIPTEGPGSFVYATETGPLLGTSGSLRRFHVAVESNVSGELDEFAALAEQTLGDPRSWIAGKQHRFQRVPRAQTAEFTVYLVTRQTAYQMCRVNGVDIRENGVPYTSCRQVRKVIINLDRWRLSVPDYVNGSVPLQTYREYVINHEVGHELGRGHEACTGQGNPAPTMQTQTLGLEGCTANPWPYLDGKRYAGPPAR